MDTNYSVFRTILSGLIQLLRQVFLPHFVAALGLWLLTAFVIFRYLLTPLAPYPALKTTLGIIATVILGALIFWYGFITACVCAIRIASSAWESFLDAQFARVEELISGKVANMDERISKEQARILVSGSVRDVFAPFKQKNKNSLVSAVTSVLVGFMTLATRSVLLRKIVKMSGKTVQLSKIFAGRALLVGAIVLNLHFFALLAQGILYLIGALVLLADFLIVFLFQ